MRHNCKIILLFVCMLNTRCKSSETNRYIAHKLMQQGYERAFVKKFYCDISGVSDEEILRSYREYHKKYKDSLIKPSFLTIPPVKDTVTVDASFPGETYRKQADLSLDTIDIYMNNKLCYSGAHPYRLQDRTRYPNLPLSGFFSFVNKKKRQEAALTVVYRNDKIYFDTIVPLRFNTLIISYDKYVSFIFR